jgi:hypothetical protein
MVVSMDDDMAVWLVALMEGVLAVKMVVEPVVLMDERMVEMLGDGKEICLGFLMENWKATESVVIEVIL